MSKWTSLAIQIQQIKCEQADLNGDIFNLDVLPLASAKLLERHELSSRLVNRHRLGIEYKRFDAFFEALGMESA